MPKRSTTVEKYEPVALQPKKYARQRSKKDADFAEAYTGLQDEFAALDVLLHARTLMPHRGDEK